MFVSFVALFLHPGVYRSGASADLTQAWLHLLKLFYFVEFLLV